MTADDRIDAKKAVSLAMAYINDIYQNEQILDPLLEEIEMNETETVWRVTVSFARQSAAGNLAGAGAIAAMFPQRLPRLYKVIEVDSATGRIRSMKIRETPNVTAQ